MAIVNLFKSRIPSCRYIFKNGKEAHFINGEYMTDIEEEIEQMNYEIKLGHPHLFVDAEKVTVDTTKLDPLSEIKAKAIAEYIARQKEATDPSNDMGSTGVEPGKLKGIGNSRGVASATAASSGV